MSAVHEVVDIILNRDRSEWYDLIIPYIKDIENEYCLRRVVLLDGWYMNFLPEELKPDHVWRFKLGDKVTDGDDIMIIDEYPLFHPENKIPITRYNISEFANKYHIYRIDDNGNKIEEFPTDHSIPHLDFNENQLQLV